MAENKSVYNEIYGLLVGLPRNNSTNFVKYENIGNEISHLNSFIFVYG